MRPWLALAAKPCMRYPLRTLLLRLFTVGVGVCRVLLQPYGHPSDVLEYRQLVGLLLMNSDS